MDFDDLLVLLKIIIFISGTLFAAAFAIPRGIVLYDSWKKEKDRKSLSAAVTYISCGVMILLFFLFSMILQSYR